MKKNAILMFVIGAVSLSWAVQYVPEEWNIKARHRFASQRFGIYIHFGLYAMYAQGEWFLETAELDERLYSQAMYGFYPSKFDAQEWVRVIKESGAKYVTVTTRHHDGFSLWPTKVDDGYNIANTPFKRDIIGELSAACRNAGIQLNLYYSLMDWHRKDYPTGKVYHARKSIEGKRPDYRSYKQFMKDQIGELIDAYKPALMWFDGEWDHLGKDWDRGEPVPPFNWEMDDIYDFIHEKKVLVANNHHQPETRDKEDIQLFERDLPGENESGFSSCCKVVEDRPMEQCDVIQDNVWGFKISEKKFRSAEQVVAMVARAAAKDSNLLMNIGPQADGRLPEKAVEVMAKVGKWFDENGESIYGTTAGGISSGKDVVSTRKGGTLYLHFLNPKVSRVSFKVIGEIESATCLAGKGEVVVERTASGDAIVKILRPVGNEFDFVAKIIVR